MTDIDDFMLLDRYLAGECTVSEQVQVEEWVGKSPVNRATLEGLREAAARVHQTMPPERKADLMGSLRRRIAASRRHPAFRNAPGLSILPSRRRGLRFTAGLAAAGLLLIGTSIGSYLVLSRSGPDVATTSPAAHTISTRPGEQMSLRLADGTVVLLAPASTLRLPLTYGQPARAVELEGQAAFTVTHDSTRPFVVRAGGVVAHDLGTRFVVRAYAEDTLADVVVAEGVVAVTRGSSPSRAEDRLVLKRGERARATPDGRLALTRDVSLDLYYAWTEGRVVFRRTPLREVVIQLRRWRNVDIQLASPALGERIFTGAFRTDEPTAEVLRLIGSALSLQVVHAESGRYTVRAK